MQSSQRTEHNLALNYAISKANKLNKPLVAFFGIASRFPEANMRHYTFMLEGLQETNNSLQAIGIKLIVLLKSPEKGITELAKDSCLTVVDKGYMKTLKQWYNWAAERMECPLVQVEDNVIVPLEVASTKEEYSAATLRPKISSKQNHFLSRPLTLLPSRSSLSLELDFKELVGINRGLSMANLDDSVGKTKHFTGGSSEAIKRLEEFIDYKLTNYPEMKNDPTLDGVSNLSPYLHFGQISPILIALRILSAQAPTAAKEAFLEELIVRRELAMNYVNYNSNYDSFIGLPNWAKKSLLSHSGDQRPYLYSSLELEHAETHDPYWNSAQDEMRITGKMHGYMRMYWGKKLIEWSETPEMAFSTAIYLNNKYELDGRDPNGFSGVAWCFGKHDRPWKERPIFGMVRYMNENGLRRKFDADEYVEKVKKLH